MPRVMLPLLVSLLLVSNLVAGRPNVVLIMADDLGWADLSSYDASAPAHAPHLEAMASNGLRFTRFYAAAPVCSPTRGSCLTGRHPNRLGLAYANSGHLGDDEETIAEVLQRAGYATGHFGKWHLGTLTKTIRDSNRGGPENADQYSPPANHGFVQVFSTEAKVPTWDPMWKPLTGASNNGWRQISDFSQAQPYDTRYWNAEGTVVNDNLEGCDSRVIMDRAVRFIDQSVKQETPFLSVIWFHSPHLPVVAGESYRKLYDDLSLHEQNYFGCISAMDEQIGRLREKLRELGVEKKTVLFFCSDNGPEGKAGQAPGSAGPLRGRKRSLYEGGIRVPGLVEWPGTITPGVTEFPSVTSDYFPTILSLSGATREGKRALDGESIHDVLIGSDRVTRGPIGFQSRDQTAWIDGRYKLVRPSAKSAWQLYDLNADLGETEDRSVFESKKTEDLITACRKWRQGLNDSPKSAR